MVMAELYHPFKDSTNLQPVKMHHQDLTKATEAWVNSTVPAQRHNDKVRLTLLQLQQEVAELTEAISVGVDNEIGSSLEKLHTTFHEIQSVFYNTEKYSDH